MNELVEILINRDGMTRDEAQELVDEARSMVAAGFDPEELLYDEFGLEPDYLFSLL